MDAISFVLGERTQNLRVRTLRVSLSMYLGNLGRLQCYIENYLCTTLCTYQLYAPLPPTRGIPGQGGDLTSQVIKHPTHGFMFVIKSPVLSHHQTRGREGDLTV